MRATADHIKATLRTQSLDTLSAEETNGEQRIGYVRGSAEDLCNALDEWIASIQGPFRVVASNSAIDSRAGKRKLEDRPFVWIVNGAYLNGAQVANPAPTTVRETVREVHPAMPPPSEYLDLVRDAALAEAQEYELDRLRDEVDELRGQMGNAAPLPWWHGEAAGKAIIETFQPIGQALGALLANLGKVPPPAAHPARKVAQGALPPDASADERALLSAWRRFAADHPDDANNFAGQLVTQYSDEADRGPKASADQPGSGG